MASYIGKQPIIGNFVKLDAITVVNGQASYTMQNGGANFTEYANVNQFLVSLNGILQSPTDSFTVSGSTITFASNLVTGDVIDHIIVLGNTLDAGVPSDNTVSLAKLTATGTKDATTFLRGDNTFAEAGGGIEMADQWRITADYNKSGSGTADITANWERTDNDFSLIGTGMTESSGIFSFPTTGIYMITGQSVAVADGGGRQYIGFNIETTTDNSTYSSIVQMYDSASANQYYASLFCLGIFDVTNITTHKVKMKVSVAGTTNFQGSTNETKTGLTFIRLGDT